MGRILAAIMILALAGVPAGCGAASVNASARPAPTSVAAGRVAFNSVGCSKCHTLAAAHATANIGPDLDVRLRPSCAELQATKLRGDTLKRCIETLIVHPYRYIPSGYFAGVMPADFAKVLGSSKLSALVNFLAADAR